MARETGKLGEETRRKAKNATVLEKVAERSGSGLDADWEDDSRQKRMEEKGQRKNGTHGKVGMEQRKEVGWRTDGKRYDERRKKRIRVCV